MTLHTLQINSMMPYHAGRFLSGTKRRCTYHLINIYFHYLEVKFIYDMALRILDTLQLEEGNTYELWLQGRRKLRLWGRREPDMFIDYIIGETFRQACNFYFSYTPKEKYYNQHRNTYKGHGLFSPVTYL